jgi:hypothetical protein
MVWNPQLTIGLKPIADEAYQRAADQDVEVAQRYISP